MRDPLPRGFFCCQACFSPGYPQRFCFTVPSGACKDDGTSYYISFRPCASALWGTRGAASRKNYISMPESALAPGRTEVKSRKTAFPIPLSRVLSVPGRHPFDEVAWDTRTIVHRGMHNGVKEEYEGEFPAFWSLNAANIAGSKYFRGRLGSASRERSVKQMIGRVAKTIREWGTSLGYFGNSDEADLFTDELTHLLLYQKAAFNSPVWFNVGIEAKPQCSACFILAVEDSMQSILHWYHTEGMIFKGGSGSGANLSSLRSSKEKLSAGGYASGLLSFVRGAASVGASFPAGGTTGRAAKMVVLNAD